MMDSHVYDSADKEQRNLTVNFVLTGFIVITLLSVLTSMASYYVLRGYNLQASANVTFENLNKSLFSKLAFDSLQQDEEKLGRLAKALNSIQETQAFVLMDESGKRVWSSVNSELVNLNDIKPALLNYIPVSFFQSPDVQTMDQSFLKKEPCVDILFNDYPLLTQHIKIVEQSGKKIGVVRLLVNVNHELINALISSIILFLLLFTFGLFVFYRLYKSFKKVLSKIQQQEDKLNENVRNLTSLLKANEQMQSNIKTASARAVELNEQFLRRVGADLHDGPAQMIGYANLRLNKIAQMEVAKEFGHEFHGVRQALDESLDEIRGISSGLVLPELESMTLEQCMRKVIAIHSVQSEAKVSQGYVDLPDEVPLPVKICAYRFVQEGLNNAEQHSNAEKYRVNVRFAKGVLQVSLKDNGIGFRKSLLSSDSVHLGLIGLKDRIESIGGAFHINSELGVGTALRFTISL